MIFPLNLLISNEKIGICNDYLWWYASIEKVNFNVAPSVPGYNKLVKRRRKKCFSVVYVVIHIYIFFLFFFLKLNNN